MELDQALEQFEQAWKSGGPPDLRQAVQQLSQPSTPATSRERLVSELVMIDFWHRWRSGAASPPIPKTSNHHSVLSPDSAWPPFPRLEDYAERYADLLDWSAPPAELIGEEYRVRRWFGENPSHDEYLQRFPTQSAHLPAVLAQIDAQTSRGKSDTTVLTAKPAPRHAPGEAEPAPATIGKYQILATLDQGGQGRVFRAMHPELRQELAIKVGHPLQGQSARELNALVAEARVLAQLDHPHFVRVHDLGFHENRPYVVLDYVPGRNLRELTRNQRLPPERSAEIIAKIARAVAAAHAHGVMHLDLKPGNILIDQHGQPRLIDFGLARQRSAWNSAVDTNDAIAGTLLYMAPEQALGDPAQISCRTDVYGLGAVLYDLLVGQPPRHADSSDDLFRQAEEGFIDTAALQSPQIPAPLARICQTALAADPADRYDSAESLAAAIEAWQTNSTRPFPKSLAALAAIVVVGLLALGAVLMISGRKSGITPASAAEEKAAFVVGHAPRHDFSLQFEIVGQPAGPLATLHDGDSIAVRLAAETDCYVGVWHVDGAGQTTMLFPNDREHDHLLRAGQSLTIPGRDGYAIEVSQSNGPEYLWAAALTESWAPEVGRTRGPAIVLASSTDLEGKDKRAASIVSTNRFRASERVIQLDVQPKR